MFRDPSPTLAGPTPHELTLLAEHCILHSEDATSTPPSRDTPFLLLLAIPDARPSDPFSTPPFPTTSIIELPRILALPHETRTLPKPCVARFMGRGKRYRDLFGQVFSMPKRRRALSKPQVNGHCQALPEDRGLPTVKGMCDGREMRTGAEKSLANDTGMIDPLKCFS